MLYKKINISIFGKFNNLNLNFLGLKKPKMFKKCLKM